MWKVVWLEGGVDVDVDDVDDDNDDDGNKIGGESKKKGGDLDKHVTKLAGCMEAKCSQKEGAFSPDEILEKITRSFL